MKRIVKLTENDLTRIVKRVIKEQQFSDDENDIRFKNASEKKIRRWLNHNWLTEEVRIISILDSEYADFSNIDLCSFPNLHFVNLTGTPNNFEEQGYECAKHMKDGLYYIGND